MLRSCVIPRVESIVHPGLLELGLCSHSSATSRSVSNVYCISPLLWVGPSVSLDISLSLSLRHLFLSLLFKEHCWGCGWMLACVGSRNLLKLLAVALRDAWPHPLKNVCLLQYWLTMDVLADCIIILTIFLWLILTECYYMTRQHSHHIFTLENFFSPYTATAFTTFPFA